MGTTNSQVSIRLGTGQAEIGIISYCLAMKQLHFKPCCPTLIVDFKDNIFWRDETNFNMNNAVNRHNHRYWTRKILR